MSLLFVDDLFILRLVMAPQNDVETALNRSFAEDVEHRFATQPEDMFYRQLGNIAREKQRVLLEHCGETERDKCPLCEDEVCHLALHQLCPQCVLCSACTVQIRDEHCPFCRADIGDLVTRLRASTIAELENAKLNDEGQRGDPIIIIDD